MLSDPAGRSLHRRRRSAVPPLPRRRQPPSLGAVTPSRGLTRCGRRGRARRAGTRAAPSRSRGSADPALWPRGGSGTELEAPRPSPGLSAQTLDRGPPPGTAGDAPSLGRAGSARPTDGETEAQKDVRTYSTVIPSKRQSLGESPELLASFQPSHPHPARPVPTNHAAPFSPREPPAAPAPRAPLLCRWEFSAGPPASSGWGRRGQKPLLVWGPLTRFPAGGREAGTRRAEARALME